MFAWEYINEFIPNNLRKEYEIEFNKFFCDKGDLREWYPVNMLDLIKYKMQERCRVIE